MSDDRWFVRLDGRPSQAYSLAQLQQMIKTGRIGRLNEVAHGSDATWRVASEFEALFPKRPEAPRPTRRAKGSSATLPVVDTHNTDQSVNAPGQTEPAKPIGNREPPSTTAHNLRAWYYALDGQSTGPVSLSDLERLIVQGTISATTPVRHQSMTAWSSTAELPELAHAAGRLPNERQSTPSMAYAGFAQRLLAMLIDSAILTGFTLIVIGIPLIPFLIQRDTEVGAMAIGQVMSLIAQWLYFAGFESSNRCATPGKMLVGLQVRKSNGRPIGFGRATGRYFSKILSGMLFGLGFLLPLIDKKRQALHDKLVDCVILESDKP